MAAERVRSLLGGTLPETISTAGLEGSAAEFAEALNQLIEYNAEVWDFIIPLSRGELSRSVPQTKNFLASPFKELHSRLMHLTWQAEQVARGDYFQRVDFMGDFSRSFNHMVEALEENERKLKEKIGELEKLNRLKNEFVGMAAHDLRNPLSVVDIYASYLLEGGSKCFSEKEEEFLRIIAKQSRFMLELINDLLDLSKIESGTLELELAEKDYHEFVRHNVALNAALASRKQVEVSLEAGAGPFLVRFDSSRIEQVLNNLVGNAVKFSPPRSRVLVVLAREGGFMQTRVIDQGPGIPAAEISSVFKEFHRGTVRPTAGEKTTGLGLAIARKIVEGHGGTIGVKSEVGAGSEFSFSIPLQGP